MAVVCAALFAAINVHAQPRCNISIPYSTGFETDVSNQAPNCWTTLLGEAYAFNFYLYAHGGEPDSGVELLDGLGTDSHTPHPLAPEPGGGEPVVCGLGMVAGTDEGRICHQSVGDCAMD